MHGASFDTTSLDELRYKLFLKKQDLGESLILIQSQRVDIISFFSHDSSLSSTEHLPPTSAAAG